MTGPVDWAKALSGHASEPQTWAQREAARIQGNTAARENFDAVYADQSRWPVEVSEDGTTNRYDPRARQQGLAEQGPPITVAWWSRPCPEHAAEERSGVAIERVDHTCWLDDRRLEQRLYEVRRIAEAEADGSIRSGMFINNRPVDAVAAEMAEHGRERMLAAQLRQQVMNARLPRGVEALL